MKNSDLSIRNVNALYTKNDLIDFLIRKITVISRNVYKSSLIVYFCSLFLLFKTSIHISTYIHVLRINS